MAKKHFVMLAHLLDLKRSIRGRWMSEKYDGIRAEWDGGISRGIPATEVPYANTEKHARFKEPLISTGLWSRYGQPIQAPDWFVDRLPKGRLLDGEFYLGRGRFEETMSIVQPKVNLNPEAWRAIEYKIFDAPHPSQFFEPRTISLPIANFSVKKESLDWAIERGIKLVGLTTLAELETLRDGLAAQNVDIIPFRRLDFREEVARKQLDEYYTEILAGGGEGVMLRANSETWKPERVHGLLKLKPFDKAKARVVDYFWAERGKIEGLIGAIRCEMLDCSNDVRGEPTGNYFRLSGFTDRERQLVTKNLGVSPTDIYEWGRRNPGQIVPGYLYSEHFPRGSTLTYTYRELTVAGLPKDGRYWRGH